MLVRLFNEEYFEVDEHDASILLTWSAYLRSDGYIGVYNRHTKQHTKLHRLVLPHDDIKLHTDHIDGDKRNNKRTNLRLVTPSQNNMNRGPTKSNKTGKKGVSWNKKDKRFRAQITIDGRKIYLGNFLTVEEASAVYEEAAIRYFGEFNRLIERKFVS